jgi:hypothetical protein
MRTGTLASFSRGVSHRPVSSRLRQAMHIGRAGDLQVQTSQVARPDGPLPTTQRWFFAYRQGSSLGARPLCWPGGQGENGQHLLDNSLFLFYNEVERLFLEEEPFITKSVSIPEGYVSEDAAIQEHHSLHMCHTSPHTARRAFFVGQDSLISFQTLPLP